jgi:hypothetical protein
MLLQREMASLLSTRGIGERTRNKAQRDTGEGVRQCVPKLAPVTTAACPAHEKSL